MTEILKGLVLERCDTFIHRNKNVIPSVVVKYWRTTTFQLQADGVTVNSNEVN